MTDTEDTPATAHEVDAIVEVAKPRYTLETCVDCGKRRKLHRDSCCMDCWVELEVKREKIRARCAKARKK